MYLCPLAVQAAQCYHSGRVSFRQQQQQFGSERKMPQVVAAELQLEAIGGDMAGGHRHHSGIVDEQVERAALFAQGGGKAFHRCQAGEVEQFHRYLGVRVRGANVCCRLIPLRRVAHG